MTRGRDARDPRTQEIPVVELTRHEEELAVGVREVPAGSLTARKATDVERVTETASVARQDVDIERVPAEEHDSGEIETLPDGSISIPLLEEQLVVTKRLVVRERIVISKRTLVDEQRIEAELRRERVELETRGDVEVEEEADGAADAPAGADDAIDNNRER